MYPGERSASHTTEVGAPKHYVVMGHIYVGGDSYEIAAGPPPHHEKNGDGGHTAAPTPAGTYRLGPRTHHTTRNWPASVVPWGASLRADKNGDIEFFNGRTWQHATGPKGLVTEAVRRFYIRTYKQAPPSMEPIDEKARSLFIESDELAPTYKRSDFGIWAWNLGYKQGGGSPYYLHTTAENEQETAANDSAAAAGRGAGTAALLEMSHGCIHVRPKDRDDMMRNGYPDAGALVVVKRYHETGPPR